MSSVADDLRREVDREVAALPVEERVRRALALGQRGIALFAEANGLTRDEAIRRLELAKQAGRRDSPCHRALFE